MNTKLHATTAAFAKPNSISDLDITFQDCMEEIEFAGNDFETRHAFMQLFQNYGVLYYPEVHSADLFDRYYEVVRLNKAA